MENENNTNQALVYLALALSISSLVLTVYLSTSPDVPSNESLPDRSGTVASGRQIELVPDFAREDYLDALRTSLGVTRVYRGEIETIDTSSIVVKTQVFDEALLSELSEDVLFSADPDIFNLVMRDVSVSVSVSPATSFPLKPKEELSVGDRVAFVVEQPLLPSDTSVVADYFYNLVPGINE